MSDQIHTMRKKLVNEKRDELKQLSRKDLVDMIDNYPNQKALNFDAEGNMRHFPIGKMVDRIIENDYTMSDKQYYALLHQFTAITVPEMKVVGISFRESNPAEFEKTLVAKKGSMSRYDIDYVLQPEPDNPYDKNAVKVLVKNEEGNLCHLGYVPADFVAMHPITKEMTIHGQLTDWSNGKFKNCSYDIAFDVEQLDRDVSLDRQADMILDDLPFPIIKMQVIESTVKDKEKLHVQITEGEKIITQNTYYEGAHFVNGDSDNPKLHPNKIELLTNLMENYHVDIIDAQYDNGQLQMNKQTAMPPVLTDDDLNIDDNTKTMSLK